MSALLWYGSGDDDAISLGDSLTMWQVFSEIARIVGDNAAFDELQSVPGFAEQTVTPWWLQQVKKQASVVLARYTDRLSDNAIDLLTSLVQEAPASSGA